MISGRRWLAVCTVLPAAALAQELPSSTETGQSPLDESFGATTRAEWLRDTRRKAWADTKFDVELRTYDFDRDNFDDSENEALAIGGHAGFKTGYFRERFALGASGYTSQRIYGPEEKDGTGLLAPGQEGYTVVGELFGELLLSEGTRLTIGRRGFDTPFLNRNDSRMSPNTFEAIALQGVHGGGEGESEWRAGAGYFDEIKQRNSDEFVSMATTAGAPAGIERGVIVAGANYRKGDLSIGAIDYYSDDIVNIFYTEAKHTLRLGKDRRVQFALQYSDQQGVGENLLGADFSSAQLGGKAELGMGGALFTVAYTNASGDSGMRSPWGSYPGYTSVQVSDFNREGEDAWMLRAAYNFPATNGLGVYALLIKGSEPDDPAQFAKDEFNLNLQWSPENGPLKGLLLRLRYARVTQDDPESSDLDELRLMAYYDPPSL